MRRACWWRKCSPAEQAGLLGGSQAAAIGGQQVMVGGDVIVAIDGRPVGSMEELLAYLQQAQPGDQVQLTVLRNGREGTVDVILGERPVGAP